MFYDADADLDLIKDKKIAVIGFGSQGHAHALNLRDSGCDVIVGLYPGSRSWTKVQDSGLQVDTVADAAAAADIVMGAHTRSRAEVDLRPAHCAHDDRRQDP